VRFYMGDAALMYWMRQSPGLGAKNWQGCSCP
jgi:hypothetical protein